jgi:hypothetical protein
MISPSVLTKNLPNYIGLTSLAELVAAPESQLRGVVDAVQDVGAALIAGRQSVVSSVFSSW